MINVPFGQRRDHLVLSQKAFRRRQYWTRALDNDTERGWEKRTVSRERITRRNDPMTSMCLTCLVNGVSFVVVRESSFIKGDEH